MQRESSPQVSSAVLCPTEARLPGAVVRGHLDMVVKRELFAWLNRLASKEGEMREARVHCLHPHIADDHIRGTLQIK